MKDDDVSVFLLPDRLAPRAEPATVTEQKRRSSAFHHGRSVPVHIRTGHIARATDHRFVIAFRSAAAQIEGNKKIEIVSMLNEERRFDALPIARQSGRVRR